VTVTNTGNQPSGTLSIALTSNTGIFNISKSTIASLAVGKTDTFVITPKTGLSIGSYSATIKVSGGNSIIASFDLILDVSRPANSIQISLIQIQISKVIVAATSGLIPFEEVTVMAAVNREPTLQDYDFLDKTVASNIGVITFGFPISYTESLNWTSGDILYVNVNGTVSSTKL
jgi:hypothetical protein